MQQPDPELIELLAKKPRAVALTGAGISADSGIPTFRDAQTGLWAKYDPMQLATPEAFQSDPQLVWDWYQWRRDLVEKAKPNQGHRVLAQMAELLPDFRVITQNVDDLHERAGSEEVIHLHGQLLGYRCFDTGHDYDYKLEDRESVPVCPHCGSNIRPNVVWFGEALPEQAFMEAQRLISEAELVLVIGTSSLVYPAAALPQMALAAGAQVVEINPEPTPLSLQADWYLQGKAGEVLPELWHHLE